MSDAFRRRAAAVPVLVVLAGCGPSEDPGPTPEAVVRDSAGVRIVENGAPDARARLGWHVSVDPVLSIGETGRGAAYELFRVEDALRLEDGRILIANGGTSEVRVFDADGVHRATWGREGEGPGEFTGLSGLADWPGDSVMAWDFALNRMTIFDLEGGVARTRALAQGDGLGAGRFEGALADGSILAASLVSFRPGEQTSGLVRRSRAFARVGPDGAVLTSFGRHPDEEYFVRADVGAVVRHPFRRSVHSVVWNERIVISPSDQYEIRAYDPGGALAMIVRGAHRPEPVTQADVDAYVALRLAEADPEAGATITRVFDGMPPVERFPAFAALVVDQTGDLWVREYERPGSGSAGEERLAEAGPIWTVFGPDGRMRGRVEMPPGSTVYRIGADYVLGSSADALGVEQVRLWPLARTPVPDQPDTGQ